MAERSRDVASEIEDAALRLFAARGFDAVTADEIAAAANVSRRTFFRYFPSKVDTLLSYYRRRQAVIRDMLAARPPHEPPFTALRNALLSGTEAVKAHPERAKLRNRVFSQLSERGLNALHSEHREAMVCLVAVRARSDPETSLFPHVLVHAALAAGWAAYERWIASGCAHDLTEMTRDALTLLEDGFADRTVEPSTGRSPKSARALGGTVR